MFTGLIVGIGDITSVQKRSGGAILSLRSDMLAQEAAIGDSISINGVCLTVVKKNMNELSFDLSGETLQSTNLGGLKKGDRVNLEPSLSAGSKIGGHFVTGHVDAAGRIRRKAQSGDILTFEIEAPPGVIGLLVEKGSVAVDGISLTVVDILKDTFTLVIIPHTVKLTTLGFKGPGDTVNIEADILGKYVARFLQKGTARDERLTKTLREEGYI
ncbi:MAG: riboflavin synthase [Nitrospirales bacterium]|nr:MAG: riboflavin synthase [Nitrospirales bacterium]